MAVRNSARVLHVTNAVYIKVAGWERALAKNYSPKASAARSRSGTCCLLHHCVHKTTTKYNTMNTPKTGLNTRPLRPSKAFAPSQHMRLPGAASLPANMLCILYQWRHMHALLTQ